jgi:sarcosine oxidase subunit gamma
VIVAAANSHAPAGYLRRSFLYRTLAGLGARFGEVNGAAVALDFGGPAEAELARGRRLGLADLSPLPRTGFKGTGAVEWLSGQGLAVGADSNQGYVQPGGEVALRLAPTEVLLIDGLGGGALVDRLNGAWSWGEERPRRLTGYPMPRSESHFWFAVTGDQAPAMFAKICGIDLRLHKFAPGAIAQTSAAKMSVIILRHDLGPVPGFYLLADSASAEYMWTCVVDAMDEFGGGPIGLTALQTLAGA